MKKPLKNRIKTKAKATKSRIKRKVKAVAAIALLAILTGCATSEPASRVTKAEYGDIVVEVANSSNTTVNLTLGDGALSSSDSAGSTESTTANPTNTTDVKPDVDVNTTGARSAGVLETAISGLLGAGKGSSADPHATTCTDGSCSPCKDCTVP